jgi:hypothetical protein
MRNASTTIIAAAMVSLAVGATRADDKFGMSDAGRIALVHAVGSQIYECQPDSAGALSWKFREPIATLFERGKTVCRHYAGPSWELADGSIVTGKVIAQTPAANPRDIPSLLLTVTSSKGTGAIAASRTIVRFHTRGGLVHGACANAGELLSEPYSADYAFFDTVRGN